MHKQLSSFNMFQYSRCAVITPTDREVRAFGSGRTENPPFPGKKVMKTGNQAALIPAYYGNNVIVIYTITPSSDWGELAAILFQKGMLNRHGVITSVDMQCDEGAAIASVLSAAQAGLGAATCSSSQGILLMIPTLFAATGMMVPLTLHISARGVTKHALTIFNSHDDVYQLRDTGLPILIAADAQEAQDLAAIIERVKWLGRGPVAMSYDGFFTSHQMDVLSDLPEAFYKQFIPTRWITQHLGADTRGLNPTRPHAIGMNSGNGVHMSSALTAELYARLTPRLIGEAMEVFEELTGRAYQPYEYYGDPEATDVLVAMGSSVKTIRATVEHLRKQGKKVGVVQIRQYRPFVQEGFMAAFPATTQRVTVLDRTLMLHEEHLPLAKDVHAAFNHGQMTGTLNMAGILQVMGVTYGVGGQDFKPGDVAGIYEFMASRTMNDFHRNGRWWTSGVVDDLNASAIPPVDLPNILGDQCFQIRIIGRGGDGAVTAGETNVSLVFNTGNLDAQSGAAYDSRKTGGHTVSSIRIYGDEDQIRISSPVEHPSYVGLHDPSILGERDDILSGIAKEGTVVVNTTQTPEEFWKSLSPQYQAIIRDKKVKVRIINATALAQRHGLGNKTSMIMTRILLGELLTKYQSDVNPDQLLSDAIDKQFGSKNPDAATHNKNAIVEAIALVQVVSIPNEGQVVAGGGSPLQTRKTSGRIAEPVVFPVAHARDYAANITGTLLSGGQVTVREAFDNGLVGGVIPMGEGPIGNPPGKQVSPQVAEVGGMSNCSACGICVGGCPSNAIKLAFGKSGPVSGGLQGLFRAKGSAGTALSDPNASERYGVKVETTLCNACGICVPLCKGGNGPIHLTDRAKGNWRWASNIGIFNTEQERLHRALLSMSLDDLVKTRDTLGVFPQTMGPSGACAGCYEPYSIAVLLQLLDAAIIANATGCSSIFGAGLGTPYLTDQYGFGTPWANILFETNAANALGLAMSIEQNRATLQLNVANFLAFAVTSQDQDVKKLAQEIITLKQISDDPGDSLGRRDDLRRRIMLVTAEAERILNEKRAVMGDNESLDYIASLSAYFANVIPIAVGGDGWAYDIGIQHLLSLTSKTYKVIVLILNTQGYSNTGGQMSGATQRGTGVAFAPGGKDAPQKRLMEMLIAQGTAFYGSVCPAPAYQMHMRQTMLEAVKYPGPAVIEVFVPCPTNHKYLFPNQNDQAALMVQTGAFPLVTFDPRTGEMKMRGDYNNVKPLSLLLHGETHLTPHQRRFHGEGRFSHMSPAQDAAAQADVIARLQNLLRLVEASKGPLPTIKIR